MIAKKTITGLRECAALVGRPVDVIVWRHPGETEAQAIERYMRQHAEIATMPRATRPIHVVSWEQV